MAHPKPRFVLGSVKLLDEMTVAPDIITQSASDADAAIITIGRNAGEGADRKLDNDYYISAFEKDLINNISNAFHQKNKK